jgi:hypothetical protein
MKLQLTMATALTAYSVVIATLLGGLTVTQAISQPKTQVFDTIDVQRINWREPDGTLRMVVANTDRMPGLIVKGVEHRHPSRHGAGILFFNDEGTESGGFAFEGTQGKDGAITSGSQLAFDQYMQDQVLVLFQNQRPGYASAGMQVMDRAQQPIDVALLSKIESMPDGPAKRAEIKKLTDADAGGAARLVMGTENDTVLAALNDAKGKPRLVASVEAHGKASIRFLDANGKPVKTIAP